MRYRFGAFEVDEAERQLRRDGAVVEIGDRAFDLLCALVRAPGRLMTKDVLMDAVWPNLFVTENNLQVQVSGLRRVLGADAVATVAGRGYRFMPEVAIAADAPAATAAPTAHESLVGRADDLSRVRDLLAGGGVVTLTGAGGIGKTTLARALAAEARAAGRPVAWIDLAALREAGLLAGYLAEACGLGPATEPSFGDVARHVRGGGWLLVLDNAEHLVEAVAAAVADLAAGAPDAAVLVTSQAPLRVAGERTHRLEGLDLPRPGAKGAEVLASGAGALFLKQARARDRHFELSDENAEAVASICRRLDGSPLALELAAGRLHLFGLRELERRLDRRFEVLTGGYRTAPTRQQTLHAVLDWSHALLPERDRLLFRRLGAFAGPFPLAWACEIGTADGQPEWSVLEALGDLLDRSLVEVADPDGGLYRLTETSRAFALERLLEAQDRPALARAVAAYAEAGAGAKGPRDAVAAYSAALALQRELQALGAPAKATMDLLLKLGPAVQAAISPADRRCGEIYGEAEALAQADGTPSDRFHAHWGVWHYLCMSGQLSLAAPYVPELEKVAASSGDDGLVLEAWHAAVTTHQLLGDAAAVVEASRRAQAIYDPARHRCLGDGFGGHDPGICACGQGAVGLWLTGEPEGAARQAAAAFEQARESGDAYSRAVGYFYAAMTFQGLGRREDFAASAEALKSVSDMHGLAVLGSEGELLAGRAAFEAGDEAGLEAMQHAFDEIIASGDTGFGMYYASLIADARLQLGQSDAAARLIEQAMGFAGQGQGFFLPELYRLRARTPGADAGADRAEAMRLARGQHASALAARVAAEQI